MPKKIEGIIKRRLRETRHCKSKNAMVSCLFKKGWVFVNMDNFAKELAKEIGKELDLIKKLVMKGKNGRRR